MKKQYVFSSEEIFQMLGAYLVNSGDLAEGTRVSVRFETYTEGGENKVRFAVEALPEEKS